MNIEFSDVVALTGLPGLHHIIKSDDRAVIVQSLDERKHRQMVKGNMMLSKLTDISIYTDDESEPISALLISMKEKYGDALPVSKKSSKDELMGFLSELLPNYDAERVYPSNVKKLIAWYKILEAAGVEVKAPEEEKEDGGEAKAEADSAEKPAEETKEKAKKKKPKAKPKEKA